MCWVAAIPIAMMAVSGVMSTVSASQEAAAANAAADSNAAVLRQNAENALYEAKYAKDQAARNVQQKQLETGALIGEQRARMGASGAVVASGSFMDLVANTAAEGAREAMAMAQEGDVASWRHEVQAGQYEWQARMTLSSKQDPNAVLAAGLIKAGASTASSAYGLSGNFGGGGDALKIPQAAAPKTTTAAAKHSKAGK